MWPMLHLAYGPVIPLPKSSFRYKSGTWFLRSTLALCICAGLLGGIF